METSAILALATLAIEALKKIPDFDEGKLQDMEKWRDALDNAIVEEDSDLILTAKNKLANMASTYKDLL